MGRSEPLSEVLLRHRRFVAALARATVSGSDAEDVEQEAWLAAATNRPVEVLQPRAWLARLVRHKALDLFRRRARRDARERAAARPEALPSAAELAERAELGRAVVAAVLALPEAIRTVLLLRYQEDLAPPDIARRLALPLETVRTRLRRGLERLREELGAGPRGDRRACLLALAATDLTPAVPAATGAVLAKPLAIGALVLLASGGAWWAWSEPPPGLVEDGRAGLHGGNAPEAPVLEGHARATPSDPPGRADGLVPTPGRVPADRRRIRGTALGIDRSPADPGRAWLLTRASESEPWVVEAQGAIDLRGVFVLEAAAATELAPVLVVASVDGRSALSAEVVAPAGRESALELVADDESMWQGRVVDPEDKPVVGLWLRYTLQRASQTCSLLRELPADSELRDRHTPPYFARARTDADGRFTIRGVGAFRYQILADPFPWRRQVGFVSESREWHVRSDFDGWRRELGFGQDGGVTLVAEPALVLTARITDVVTGAPVTRFEGHAHRGGHREYVGFDGTEGDLGLRWERWWPADEDGLVELAIEAPGYAPLEASVRYGIGQRTAHAVLHLRPLAAAERARLRFELVDPAGEPLDAPWWARIVDPRDPGRTLRDLGFSEVEDPGVYEVAAPPGRWTIRIKPNDWLGFLDWKGEVDLREGGTTKVHCVMAPHGALVVRVPASEDPLARVQSLSVAPVGGEGSGVLLQAGETEFRSATVPEGEYVVRMVRGTGTQAERRVHVRRGEEAVVDFTK